MWRVIQNAKVMQSTTKPCKTALSVNGKVQTIAGRYSELDDAPLRVTRKELCTNIKVAVNGGIEQHNGNKPLVIGEEYTVILDGVKYKFTAKHSTYRTSGLLGGVPCIGAVTPHAITDAEPVYIGCYHDIAIFDVFVKQDLKVHTIVVPGIIDEPITVVGADYWFYSEYWLQDGTKYDVTIDGIHYTMECHTNEDGYRYLSYGHDIMLVEEDNGMIVVRNMPDKNRVYTISITENTGVVNNAAALACIMDSTWLEIIYDRYRVFDDPEWIEDGEEPPYYETYEEANVGFKPGDTVRVRFNGSEYICTAYVEEGYEEYPMLGCSMLWGYEVPGSVDVPFLINAEEYDGVWSFYIYSTTSSMRDLSVCVEQLKLKPEYTANNATTATLYACASSEMLHSDEYMELIIDEKYLSNVVHNGGNVVVAYRGSNDSDAVSMHNPVIIYHDYNHEMPGVVIMHEKSDGTIVPVRLYAQSGGPS